MPKPAPMLAARPAIFPGVPGSLPIRRSRRPHGRSLPWAFVALLVAGACATAAPPRTFRFASNLEAPRAFACAADRLRARGFDVTVDAQELTATALLRREPAAARPAEWWRVALTVTPQAGGSALVESVAGVGPRAEGPFEAPPGPLVTAVAEIPSRCMWPQ